MSSPNWKAAQAVRATWGAHDPDVVAEAVLRAVHYEELLGERDRLRKALHNTSEAHIAAMIERDEWKRKAEAWHSEAWARMNEAQAAGAERNALQDAARRLLANVEGAHWLHRREVVGRCSDDCISCDITDLRAAMTGIVRGETA